MSRKNKYKYREIEADIIYQSVLVTKLIKKVMRNGKLLLAEKIVYDALSIVKEKLNVDSLLVLENAVKNVSLDIGLRYIRLGAQIVPIPYEVSLRRKESVALNLIVNSARDTQKKKEERKIKSEQSKNKKKKWPMERRLAREIIASYNNEGKAVEETKRIRKIAELNKGYVTFR